MGYDKISLLPRNTKGYLGNIEYIKKMSKYDEWLEIMMYGPLGFAFSEMIFT